MRNYLILGAVLVFALVAAGCPDAKERAQNLSGYLVEESVQYAAVLKLNAPEGITRHGEFIAEELGRWANATQKVVSEMKSLAKQVEDLSDSKNELSEEDKQRIKTQLQDMMRHQADIRLTVPSWQMDGATTAARQISSAYASIPGLYGRMFAGETLVRIYNLEIRIEMDTEIVDTLPKCIKELNEMGQMTNEPYCGDHAYEICSHQMKMPCVRDEVKKAGFAHQSCQDYDAKGNPLPHARSWYVNIGTTCRASSPVLRKAR